jgi:predicted nucleic acid-binding protein
MTFLDLPAGADVFLDANTLVYHFTAEPLYGAACTALMKRIENRQLGAVISADVLADIAHRLMTLEAASANGWPLTGLAARLRKHHGDISKLTIYRQAITDIAQAGIRILPISQSLVEAAAVIAGRYELLMGDAVIVAAMQGHGLTNLASSDSDFDRVPGISRYGPV